jgi:hypothetical protein
VVDVSGVSVSVVVEDATVDEVVVVVTSLVRASTAWSVSWPLPTIPRTAKRATTIRMTGMNRSNQRFPG